MAPVQFSVLGRVAVAADGSTCGSPVGASVPSSPRFSRLRSLVEPDRAPRAEPRLLISSGGGDALLAEPDCVDAEQFEALDDIVDSDLVRAESLGVPRSPTAAPGSSLGNAVPRRGSPC